MVELSEPLKVLPVKGVEHYSHLAKVVGETFSWGMPPTGLDLESGTKLMLLNLGERSPLRLELSRDWGRDVTVFDPYKHEGRARTLVDPKKFQREHVDWVPPGHVDVLAKWYSVKFTYPDHNRIFVLPGWGISLQKHALRDEYWTIRSGRPIVVVGERVHYDVAAGTEFCIPAGTLHSVANPHEEGVVFLEERYGGTFDEEDITRVFNPNQYSSGKTK
ncbi:MAG: hypothetical protein Kow0069_19120 [Promethearchaeota archaeon]